MQVVLNVKGSFRTTGSGHNREVIDCLIQVATRTGSTVVLASYPGLPMFHAGEKDGNLGLGTRLWV